MLLDPKTNYKDYRHRIFQRIYLHKNILSTKNLQDNGYCINSYNGIFQEISKNFFKIYQKYKLPILRMRDCGISAGIANHFPRLVKSMKFKDLKV